MPDERYPTIHAGSLALVAWLEQRSAQRGSRQLREFHAHPAHQGQAAQHGQDEQHVETFHAPVIGPDGADMERIGRASDGR